MTRFRRRRTAASFSSDTWTVARSWPVVCALSTLFALLVACNTETLKSISTPSPPSASAPTENAAVAAPSSPAASRSEKWKSLTADGLHDPRSPAIKLLQQPAEALAPLPSDEAGNKVDWIAALDQGLINPRTNIRPDTHINVLDLDIFLSLNGALPIVKFPHRQHTMWLDCENCHEQIFKKKAGATPITMTDILEGKYCGQCHGAVAFPLTECNRCHSVLHRDFKKALAESKNKVVVRPK
ncbi:MAG: cytochrome c, class I [Rhodospirillales bacterium CG15_BIG_FIL_POST_REV_8_21_14_020_66_15]|nr:MAG: cytochrome c, class I [Rhodospirillales bacterium CG15_BIG_FIL_POST_REV_8_21_14_020_66_15]